ncbi:MAG: DUF6261 family protein [Bacteroidales bacterium]|jgi:hypothetical protein|nr:DUF6261 family protein [Bacteroidales bacterium]
MNVKAPLLTNLRNEEHFQFMSDVADLLSAADERVKTALGKNATDFTNLQKREDAALEQIRKNQHSKSLAEMDAARDTLYKGLMLLTDAYASFAPQSNEALAAEKVQGVIDHYGDFSRKPYNEQTGTLHNFIQELETGCTAALTTMHAEAFITTLKNINKEFQEVMNVRYDEKATTEVENLRDLRLEIDTLYRKIASIIESSIVIFEEQEYIDFAKKLNERVAYYNTTLKARKGVAAKKEETAE